MEVLERLAGGTLLASLMVQRSELEPPSSLPDEAEKIQKRYQQKIKDFVKKLNN